MEITTEVAVIGAGPAGVCAALAAARAGSKVVLVSDRPVLGGNSSSEIRVWTRGATGAGNLFSEEMGIWGELKLRNLYANPDGNPVLWSEVLLDGVLAEKNITLLLNTHVTTIDAEQNKITKATAFQMGTEKSYDIFAQMYLDCTGDGTLGAQAGVPFVVGKEERGEYQESFAAERPDGTTQGNSLLFFVKDAGHPVAFVAPQYAYPISQVEQLIGAGGRVVGPEFSGSDYWWFETGGMASTITDAQEITLELKRLVMGVWNYIKNSGKFDASSLTLEWFGSLPGKRESRRMKTDYILTQKDVVDGGDFPDTAFYGGWYIDFHPAEGVFAKNDSCKQLPVNIYPIPLRCLYNSKVENLLFAGRNMGASHVAFASSRIMNTCALAGQAAGTLAAFCAAQNTPPKKAEVSAVQEKLLRDDLFLPGRKARDAGDLSQTASLKTNFPFRHNHCAPDKAYPLTKGAFVTLPYPPEGRFTLWTQARRETRLFAEVYTAPVPSRFKCGRAHGNFEIFVNQGRQLCNVTLPKTVNAGFVTIEFAPNADVDILTQNEPLPGLLIGHPDSPAYETPCLQMDFSELYDVKNLTDGYHRPYQTPHAWVAGEGDRPSVFLRWEQPCEIDEVQITFDPSLSEELASSRAQKWSADHRFCARSGMPTQLVQSFALYGRRPGARELEPLYQEEHNWKRMVRIRLEQAILLEELKLVVLSTYGTKHAVVYEIRAYKTNQKEKN